MKQTVIMQEKIQMDSVEKLMAENVKLRETLAIALNKPLIRELSEAIREIENGKFLTENEFAKKFHLKNA